MGKLMLTAQPLSGMIARLQHTRRDPRVTTLSSQQWSWPPRALGRNV